MAKKESIHLSRYQVKDLKDNKRLYGVISNGPDNLYSDYLNGLYNNSVTHQSVINDLVGYTMGSGLKAVSEQDQQLLDRFFSKKVLRKIFTLKEIHQTVSLEVLKSRSGKIVELNVFNPAQIRVQNIDDGEPFDFLYRKSWDRNDTTNYRVREELENILYTDKYEGLFYWYDSGTFPVYYGRPRYMGGLNAIELEIAIYMMHNHGAQQGMFPSMVIAKPSSGDPKQDKQDTVETQRQLVGPANAGKIITTYFPNGGTAPQFSTPNLTGIDKIYENQYQVSESGILKAHSVPSPLLIAGLNQKSGGFGSLEEELEWAKQEMFKKLIIPKRSEILEILDPIFKMIGIEGDVDFEDEVDKSKNTTVVAPNDTEQKFSNSEVALSDFISLGETEEDLQDYDLIQADRLDGEPYEPKFEDALQLASTPSSSWQKESEQDTPLFKVRYRYGGSPVGERDFCRKLVRSNKVFRKEDITQLESQRVNPGFGPNGQDTYNVWFFKGGPQCRHFWERRVYMRRNNRPISVNEARRILNDMPIQERDENRLEVNDRDVAKRPQDMPNNGYLRPRMSREQTTWEKLKNLFNGSK